LSVADLNTEFLQVFEAIKSVVNRLADDEDSQEFKLSAACRKNARVQRRRTELEYIKDVRNLHVHQQQSSGLPTFALTPTFVDFCRSIQAQLAQATTAGKIGVNIKDVAVARWDDPILPIIAAMRENCFSHIPIMGDAGVVEGVFNEAAILAHLMSSKMMMVIEAGDTLNGLHDQCRIGADHIETFQFISPSASEDQVTDVFLTVSGPFSRVGAVFVTPNAASDKPVQRMITAWDVLAQSKVN
jgi:predicted transcriptional regulator